MILFKLSIKVDFMVQTPEKHTIKQQLGFGLSALMLILPLSVCFGAVTGQGLLVVLFCALWCTLLSLLSKRNIFAPTPLYIVPFFFVCFGASFFAAVFAVSSGACLCALFSKKLKEIHIPDFVISGAMLGLCLGATILLTNSYFGIGAFGSTPFEMLKSYRSLGFHPHFMGLLTGTITLFTMITYPFKFKKLNKYIPAPFITLLIPFILNLFLNPQSDYTAINEAICLTPVTQFNLKEFVLSYSPSQIPIALQGAFIFGIIFSGAAKHTENKLNGICSIAHTFPITAYPTKAFTIVSSCVVVLISIVTIIFFPEIFSRLPMHSVGSMLIVFAWQSLPYKKIACIFKIKHNRVLSIIGFVICTLSFVFLNAFTAILICLVFTIFPKRRLTNEQ